ncbi:cytochrome c [Aestuariicoccus sp. MJ-SS9]|uniref:c-type cytochrome n=1 Tax=Aestuariicoccus sp. MJ-SS9 TaxID=3079855 RepID=UPI00290E108A|nr:cytochrome c [Aestuariicoccus sp. MJ-SS9]MDU8912757.1 cytochrome c [Aestuariicoccus sp. MJ-SS9]
MKKIYCAAAAVATLGFGGFAWAQMNAGQSPGILPYDEPARVANGATIYAENCAACHGADLEGQPNWKDRDAAGYLPAPPHDETGHTWHHDDILLVRITALGTEAIVGGGYKSNMMGFAEVLSADEILDVLAYIKSTWPPQVVETHNQINARAQVFRN